MTEALGLRAGASAPRIAVVGAGPVGLAAALLAAERLPAANVTVFDARAEQIEARHDPRTLALSLGSVQLLKRLQAWNATAAEAITQVMVSQSRPAPGLGGQTVITASRQNVPFLGAVAGYGDVLAPLAAAWRAQVSSDAGRLSSSFGAVIKGFQEAGGLHLRVAQPNVGRVESFESSTTEQRLVGPFDLVVAAEGGVFDDQMSRPWRRDYGQTAWVGEVSVQGIARGLAIERFTPGGPVALLPLPSRAAQGASNADRHAHLAQLDTTRMALVWCVRADDDPVRDASLAQRLAALHSALPVEAGRVVAGLDRLKDFALGLNAEPRPVTGRLVRIGNAAQTLHPVAGQGLNLGLRDAYALIDSLVTHKTSAGPDLDEALKSYARHRMPDRLALMGTTDLLARTFTWEFPGLNPLRALGLSTLEVATPLRQALARGFMFGWR